MSALPLTNGECYQLIYAGRPGGSPGPDIRDAILNFSSFHSRSDFAAANNRIKNTIGDVEIHIRATDWFVHQHHTDKRYNNVVLHIVLISDNIRPTLRQDGTIIPTCSLNDIIPNNSQSSICAVALPSCNNAATRSRAGSLIHPGWYTTL